MSLPRVWINAQETTRISILDRGLSYGDGFFTTALVHNGRWLNAAAHLWRIEQSCSKLHFPQPDTDALLSQIKASFAQLADDRSELLVLKLMLTRGQGGRGYQPPEKIKPSIIIQWMAPPVDLTFPEPIRLQQCQIPVSINPAIAGIKHLNRLENVLAKSELSTTGYTDGLMQNPLQQVICSTQANLFLLQGNKLLTPNLTQSGVHGTVRYSLQKLAADFNLQWCEEDVSWLKIQQADALFLSNAIRGIMPVASLQFSDKSVRRFDSVFLGKIADIATYFQQYQQDTAIDLYNENLL